MQSKRNRNRLLFFLLIFFGVFAVIFMMPSSYNNALKELGICRNEKEVKNVWDKYISQLHADEAFEAAVRDKLDEFPLTFQQIDNCLIWLPTTPVNLNVIIVPDLTEERFRDTVFNLKTKEEDIELIKIIRSEFKNHVGVRDTKDRFMVALASSKPPTSQIKDRTDKLYLNMEGENNSPIEPFFTDHQKNKFSQNINELYSKSIEASVKTDFYTFFNSRLSQYLKKSTIYDRYVNKLIILTDGNIKRNNGAGTTEFHAFEKEFKEAKTQKEIIKILHQNNVNLEPAAIDLNNTHVIICQIGANSKESFIYESVLSAYWYDWFEQMGRIPEIVQRSLPNDMIAEKVTTFLKN